MRNEQHTGRSRGRDLEGDGIRTGKPDVKPDLPSHVKGVRSGNSKGNMEQEPGIKLLDEGAVAAANRSTGINPADREPIDPRMPHLPPP